MGRSDRRPRRQDGVCVSLLLAAATLVACGGSDTGSPDEVDTESNGAGASGAGTTASAGSGGTGTTTGTGGGPIHPADCSDFDARFAKARADLEASLASNGVPGASIAILCGGQVKSAGVGVVKNGGAAVTASTRFQLASITKMLTAATALVMEEQGTIDVAAPVSKVMPSLAYGDEVTLGHLLSHTSGLDSVFYNWTGNSLSNLVLANPNLARWSPPGAVWNYDNYGYAVAGGLLEHAAGGSFPNLVTDLLLSPLGMTRATMRVSEVMTGDFAYGHSGDAASPTVLGPMDSYYDAPDYSPMGGAWASAEDLVRFAGAMSAKQHQSRSRTGEGPDEHYGYGAFVDEGVSPKLVYHGGSVEGFLGDVEIVPDAGIAAAVLVNADWYFPYEVTSGVTSAFVDFQPVGTGPDAAGDALLTGVYESTVFGEVAIESGSSGLTAAFHDRGYSAPLTSSWYNTYEVDWVDEPTGPIPITFWLEGDQACQYLVSRWGVAQRK